MIEENKKKRGKKKKKIKNKDGKKNYQPSSQSPTCTTKQKIVALPHSWMLDSLS
jgi:hypothetical protein